MEKEKERWFPRQLAEAPISPLTNGNFCSGITEKKRRGRQRRRIKKWKALRVSIVLSETEAVQANL